MDKQAILTHVAAFIAGGISVFIAFAILYVKDINRIDKAVKEKGGQQ